MTCNAWSLNMQRPVGGERCFDVAVVNGNNYPGTP